MKYLYLLVSSLLLNLASAEGTLIHENKHIITSCVVSQAEPPDSLSFLVYVSFVVNKKGEVKEVRHEKTECLNYELSRLDSTGIKELEAEAVRVVSELDDMPTQKRSQRFTLPIRSKLPAERYLKTPEMESTEDPEKQAK